MKLLSQDNRVLIGVLSFFLIWFFASLNENGLAWAKDNGNSCSVSGIGFHTTSMNMAIKFNSNGRFNSSDKLLNIPKSFWGTWEQQGNRIITTVDRSSTGMGIGQQNTYTYDCDKLTISGFTLVKD